MLFVLEDALTTLMINIYKKKERAYRVQGNMCSQLSTPFSLGHRVMMKINK
jgi:hypothetical protein